MNPTEKEARENQPLMLQGAADGTLTLQLAEEQLRGLAAQIAAVVAAAEVPMETIRELCGPERVGLAAHLFTMLNLGAGYFRESRDVLASAFRAHAQGAKRANCPHPRLRFHGRDGASCAICGHPHKRTTEEAWEPV